MILVRCTRLDDQALAGISYDPEEIKDDGTDYEGVRVKKPWGHEVERYKDENVAIWWLHIHSHQQTSMHCHPNKATLLFVVSGRATISSLNGSWDVSPGDMVMIQKGAFHRTTSLGDNVVLYEIETPANKRDLVRLEDFYNRGQGYERTQPAEELPPA